MEAFHDILLDEEFFAGFQYVPPEFFSYLMSHLCCMATTFPTDESTLENITFPKHIQRFTFFGIQCT